jgi:hypothetical protein
VVALADVPSLVVMRPIKNNRYTYVGEAYIHGAMDGELTENANVRDFEVE